MKTDSSFTHLSLYDLYLCTKGSSLSHADLCSSHHHPTRPCSGPSVSAPCIADHLFASATPLQRILATLLCYPNCAISIPTGRLVTCSQAHSRPSSTFLCASAHIRRPDSQLQGLRGTNTDKKELRAEAWNPMPV